MASWRFEDVKGRFTIGVKERKEREEDEEITRWGSGNTRSKSISVSHSKNGRTGPTTLYILRTVTASRA